MKRNRRTKIVATIGPASGSPEQLNALFLSGVDVFRLNCSHGDHAVYREHHANIRALETRHGRPTTILLDLQGPKLRVGCFAGGKVQLNPGALFTLDRNEALGTAERVHLPHSEFFAGALKPGDDLLLDDGRLRLRVESADHDAITTRVVHGGALSDRKGVNVPTAILPLSAMTPKDHADLEFGLSLGVDWVALSFVQQSEDLTALRKLVGDHAWLMAKIEKPAALTDLVAIVQAADGVMVARGDLGVELPAEKVPAAQRKIVREARHQGKPVIVATQMLESMVQSPVPTRAEASDVATAVMEGADAVMLSAETATGAYPREAVTIMDRILQETEAEATVSDAVPMSTQKASGISDAICLALRQTSLALKIPCAVTYTSSGATTLRAARERLPSALLALTPNELTARRLGLAWGVHAVHASDVSSVEAMIDTAVQTSVREGLAKPDDTVSVVAGMPFGTPGTTNLLRLVKLT
ncbi:Pyruvate kinase [plant metagenome]|uniref:pyruvate kinase n=1 Tax=plant metagenome TaxID=1297885 RepID=A0A484TD62_9ZZZZ